MTKNENSERNAGIMPPFAWHADPRARRMMAQPLTQWLRLQADLLQMGEKMASHWLQRQREAMAATAQAFGRLTEARDYRAAAAVQHDWLDQQMRGLGSDIQLATEGVMALSQMCLLAMQGGAESAAKSTEPARDVAKTKQPEAKVA
jgi:hypothetical protein